MSPPAWRTVFDAATVPYPDWPLAGVVLALAGLGLLVAWRASRPVGLGLGIAAALLGVFGVALPYRDFVRLQALARSDALAVAEGPVTGHVVRTTPRPDRPAGDDRRVDVWEEFTVDGTTFGFHRGHGGTTLFFTNAQPPPLALDDGRRVRVHWLEDAPTPTGRRILRLEVAAP
jgi:hypothetical protein